MEAVTEYIKRNSNGRKQPIRGSTIASAFGEKAGTAQTTRTAMRLSLAWM